MARRPGKTSFALVVEVEHIDGPGASLEITRAFDLLMRAVGQVSEPAAAPAEDDGSLGARRGKAMSPR